MILSPKEMAVRIEVIKKSIKEDDQASEAAMDAMIDVLGHIAMCAADIASSLAHIAHKPS